MKLEGPKTSPATAEGGNLKNSKTAKSRKVNMMNAIVIEQYTDEEMEKSWDKREGVETIMIEDEDLKHTPVFILNVGRDYSLRIVIRHKHRGFMNKLSIRRIRLQPDDGYVRDLKFQRLGTTDMEEEVRARVITNLHQSRRLNKVSPGEGKLEDKYVQLEISIDLASDIDPSAVYTLRTSLYCKMVAPDEPPLRFHQFIKGAACWEKTPNWFRNRAFGAVAVEKAPSPFAPKFSDHRAFKNISKVVKSIKVAKFAGKFFGAFVRGFVGCSYSDSDSSSD